MSEGQITKQQTTLRAQYEAFKAGQEVDVMQTVIGFDTENEFLVMLDKFDTWTEGLALEDFPRDNVSQKSLQAEIQEILSQTMGNFFRDNPALHRASFQVVCDETNNPPDTIADYVTFAIAVRFSGLGIIITLLRSHPLVK